MINFFDGRRKPELAATARVKTWAALAFSLPAETSVTVAELRCAEAGCPDVETVIGLLVPGAARKYKLLKPVAEVTREDIFALAESTPPGETP